MGDTILYIMNIIGIISFAVSGALIAISCSLDLFGVVFIALITAVGGGIARDILLGNFPPKVFYEPITLLIALLSAIIVFIFSYFNKNHFKEMSVKVERINNVFDAIGLSTFTVAGTEIAILSGYALNPIIAIALGMITGVGGGIMRDVLVCKPPYVLNKHVYALASLLGGGIYYVIAVVLNLPILATFSSIAVVITIRILASKYRWELPKIKF